MNRSLLLPLEGPNRGGVIGGPCGFSVSPMTTTTHHQLDQVRREWDSLSRSCLSREAAHLLQARSSPLKTKIIEDLRDIITLLELRSPLTQQERSTVVADLLTAVPENPLFARTLLQTLIPGIVTVARRLRWGQGGSEDQSAFLGDLITAAYELIIEWGGQVRPYAAPDLLNALRCRMRRRLEVELLAQTRSLDLLIETDALAIATVDGDPTQELGAMIMAAREDLDPLGAAALYGREVLGMTYRELAELTGASPKRLAMASREVARRILQ